MIRIKRLPLLARLAPALLAPALLALAPVSGKEAASWLVPFGGNAYLTAGAERSNDGLGRDGSTRWQDGQSVFSVFVRVDRPALLDLALRLKVPQGSSVIRATVGEKSFEVKASGAEVHVVKLGQVEAKAAGYVRVDLRGVSKEGPVFAEVSELVVSSPAEGLQLDHVKNNEGNMFYWGRRGPSVHLGYAMPRDKKIEYAYSELTVPEGEDPIGSYFMANGFGEGYYGIQVKSPTERWILFSVWSPFKTDNPREIPEAERVVLLDKGEGVRVGEFGNEGSGGQSFLVYPWKAGVTYRFLTSVKPDGQGNSIYAAWFGEVGKDGWKLIARFKRPKTDKHLTGFHSFLENFADREGHRGRRALHGNQWVRDTDGVWHEVTEARFTGDATAGGGHRLDYAGGVEGKGFFLRNGGFFNDPVKLNQSFKREPTPAAKPRIDFGKLD
jgi:hypothetical protein